MKFSLPTLFQKKTDIVYAALLLSAEGGHVYYLRPDATRHAVSVVGSQKLRIHAGLDGLIDDLDDALYNLDTTHKVRAQELILFVSDAHIDATTRQLHKPFLKSIKDISGNLDLKPIGFIECYEAVIRHMQATSHAAVQAIVLEVENTAVSVMVVSQGRILHHDKVARLDDWLAGVHNSLATLKHRHPLPSQIVVYSPDATPIHERSIEQYDWDGLFTGAVHVKHYSHQDLVNTLLESFAKQLFPETDMLPHMAPALADQAVPVSVDEKREDAVPFERAVSEESDLQDEEEYVEEAEHMGFAIGHEATPGPSTQAAVPEQLYAPPVHDYMPADGPTSSVVHEPKLVAKMSLLATAKTRVAALLARLSLLRPMKKAQHPAAAPAPTALSHRVTLIVAGVISFIALVLLLEFTLHTATIRITLPSEELTQTVRLPKDFKYKQATISSDFTAKTTATGEKFVGDRAKGSVTIYNSDTSGSVSLDRGQEITSSDGFIFQLNESVKVASASGDASSITSSTAKVDVTATDIGPEYNLKSGSKFTISGFSSTQTIAKNDTDMSGGSKKKVTVVSEEDYETLTADVQKQAEAFTQKKLKETDSIDVVIIPEFTDTQLSKNVYTSDVGDEVDQVALDTTATISYTAIDKKDALSYFEQKFTGSAGAGAKLLPETFEFSIARGTGGDADSPSVSVEGKIKSVKRVDQAEIKKAVAYKSVSEMQDYLRNSYNASDITVSQMPPLPLWIPATGQITLSVEY